MNIAPHSRASCQSALFKLQTLLLCSILLAPWAAQAGEGHDHGEAASGPVGQASPRFVAASDTFELVGIFNGKVLALYLDHAGTNAPVKDAKLELEFGGTKLKVEPHGLGEFEVIFAQAPKPGVIPVSATVVAGKDSDLLAGELDLHDAATKAPEASGASNWKKLLPWVAGLGGLVAVLWIAASLLQRRKIKTTAARSGAL